MLLSVSTVTKPLPVEDDLVTNERSSCNSVFADKFHTYGDDLAQFSTSTSGGLCSLLIRCGQRIGTRLTNCASKQKHSATSPASTTMGSHGPRALMEQPTVDTWRQRHQKSCQSRHQCHHCGRNSNGNTNLSNWARFGNRHFGSKVPSILSNVRGRIHGINWTQ